MPDYKAFTAEPASKRIRRHKKYSREAREAKEIQKNLNMPSLQQQIALRQQERSINMPSFLDKLMEKYADVDDEDEFKLDAKARKQYKKVVGSTSKKPTTQKTKGGRVQKAKK